MNQLLLQAHGLQKSFGGRTLFSAEKLEVRDGDRIGLTGPNGAGKSTLLHILYGAEPCDAGRIDRLCPLALVRQSGEAEGDGDARMLRALSVSGSACMSGGERTRRAIAAAMSQNTPLLLADEPTTNLDLSGIETLQKLLLSYRGAVILVSHDRALLDSLCTAIWALEDGTVRVFPGSYSDWVEQKKRERAFRQFEYEQYRSEKQRLEAGSRDLRQKAHGMRKAPKRMGNSEARLHKRESAAAQGQVTARAAAIAQRAQMLEVRERPAGPPEVRMALGAANPIAARYAARIEDLTVRYGKRTVLDHASFTLPAGIRTVMVGDNGAGKTTLVEHLMHGGDRARFASGVRAGYFSQNHDILDPERTVLENVRDGSPLAEHEARTILANLGLAGDSVFKRAGLLSGGERAKTAFARLLAGDCNLLVLDEPTNHIDLYTAEALEALLCRWRGALLVVTHDRRLIERVAQRLLFVEGGRVRAFEGSWADWRAERERRREPPESLDSLIEQMRRASEFGR